MVGRTISNVYPKETVPIGEEILRVEHLSSDGLFEDINLTLHKGEIVGLAGLVGAGRTELARVLAGFDPVSYTHLGRSFGTGVPCDLSG